MSILLVALPVIGFVNEGHGGEASAGGGGIARSASASVLNPEGIHDGGLAKVSRGFSETVALGYGKRWPGSHMLARGDRSLVFEGSAQVTARAAAESARLAAVAADAVRRAAEWQAADGHYTTASSLTEAAYTAARAAVDAAREAAQAAEDAGRISSRSTPLTGEAAWRAAEFAQEEAERASETAREAADRPDHVTSPLPSVSAVRGMLEGFWKSVEWQTNFTRGRALLGARKHLEARDQLSKAVMLDPAHDKARALLGWSEYFRGDFGEAIATFKSALRRQPTWESLYDGLGWSRLRLGRPHLALAAFRSALEQNPSYLDAKIGLGSALFALGQYDAALPALRQALRQCLLGRYQETLPMLRRAIQATPDQPEIHAGIGWCYLKLGPKWDARAAFWRAIDLRSSDGDAGLRGAGSESAEDWTMRNALEAPGRRPRPRPP